MTDRLRDSALEYHRLPRPGKLAITPTKPLANQRDLALAYSPGVAAACEEIVADPATAADYTGRANLVAVVTNGTAVLGLGAIGPLANANQFKKVQGLIQKGIDEGAKVAAGGVGRPDGFKSGYYVEPTVFANVSNEMTIAREEIFGPVLVIIPYDTEEEAIRIANDTPYGLSAYVQGSEERARKVAEASGGLFGVGKISSAEQRILDAVAGAFAD